MDLLLIQLFYCDGERLIAFHVIDQRLVAVNNLSGSLSGRHDDRIAAVDHGSLALFHALIDNLH